MAENQPVQKADDTNEKKPKKSGNKLGCLIVLLILFVTPVLAVGTLYYFSKDFKLSVNGVLSQVPGPVGSYFENFPTQSEEMDKIRIISDYMLSITEDRAVDKLLVLKGEDSRAYDEVIKDMIRINPNRTKYILETIRSQSLSKDAVVTTVQKIEDEKIADIKTQADYIASLPVSSAITEIQKITSASINGHKDAAQIFENMSDEAAEKILYQLEEIERNKIFSFLSEDKNFSIKQKHNEIVRKERELTQIAGVYKSENPATLINTVGDTKAYTVDELAIIYKHLGPMKAGEVLAKSRNDTFVFQVIEKMKENELLKENVDNITPDVLKSLKIYREFDDNVSELVKVYSKMGTDKVADIIKNMMLNASPSKVYELDNGDMISISDERLMLEILKSFPEAKKAEILSMLDKTLSSELTRKLALPEN
ncbi:magnesium and cobalt transport protein CorA [Fusibacter ferrireducens]|uniref:Uncharacterized protein n=1 Tax=Fusibacter ferrireducens TaxID=2785058 RepID=A0ABR9ZMN6_9FIRM|nr:hypothetical protein [Fusibacter ferrireducens]MBF4691727.1 hypothetical protein [Fusibacter ferrireducens]